MTLRAHELARLLLAGPNHVVTTWDGGESHSDGCDSEIEQVVRVDGHKEPVIVLGLDLPVTMLDGAEVLYGDGPGIAKSVARYQQQQKKAQGE